MRGRVAPDRFLQLNRELLGQLTARVNTLRLRGLTAAAFQTPMVTDRNTVTEKNAVTCCRTITGEQPRFWEIWSSAGSQIDLVAVTSTTDLAYYAERVRSSFQGAQYGPYAHRTEDRPGTDVRILLPPFIREGLYFKVLNCREKRPFQAFEDLNFEDDKLHHLLNALQSLSSASQPIHVWVSVGWREYDWSHWARMYGLIKQPRAYETLRGRMPGGRHAIQIEETITTPEKEAATKTLEAAREPNVCATIRIAVFSPSQDSLAEAVDRIHAALLSFKGKKGGYLTFDQAPFEVDVGRTVNDGDALMMMAGRRMGFDPARLIQRYIVNLKRGMDEGVASDSFPIPYILMNSDELSLFVHLPIRAGEKNLPSIEWTRTAFTTIVEYPEVDAERGIEIGVRHHDRKPVRLDLRMIMEHLYALGKTQSGKSTLMGHIVLGLARRMVDGTFNGSIFLIDPHGDLAERLKRKLPREALEFTLFLNPRTSPWGMNLLALPKYKDEHERDQRITGMQDNFARITRETVKGIAGSESWGPRLASIISEMQGALYYSRNPAKPMELRDAPTISELVDLISAVGDREELDSKLAALGLPESIRDDVYATFKDMPSEAKQAVFTKLRWFLRPFIKPFTCSPGNNLAFEELVKPRHIVIFSFKGLEADDTIKSALMASIIMKLYAAVLQEKGPIPADERWPTLLIVDEFQRAVGIAAFEEIVTQAAKYKLALMLAHQALGQITKDQGRDVIIGNMHTIFAFTPGSADAGEMAKELDLQFWDAIAQGLNALPAYNAFMKISSKGMDEQRPPIRIVIHPPDVWSDQRTLQEADDYFKAKMAPFAPPTGQDFYRQTKATAPGAGARCMELWKPHGNYIPPPSLYPTFFAIRDYVMVGLEVARATDRPVVEVGVWPTFAQLADFIIQNRTRYAYAIGLTRGRLQEALERLKSGGFIKENMENWAYSIEDRNPEKAQLLRSLVLFNVSAGQTVTGGGELHRNMTLNFLQDYVRQQAHPHLPKYPEQTGALPDGVLVPAKQKADEWDWGRQVAVECEVDADRHWDRVLGNILRDIDMGYHTIIIIANTRGGKEATERHIRESDEIPEGLKERIHTILWELRFPIFRR